MFFLTKVDFPRCSFTNAFLKLQRGKSIHDLTSRIIKHKKKLSANIVICPKLSFLETHLNTHRLSKSLDDRQK